jgi:anthranilate/para-aminobenzoate synthase component I
MFALELPHCSAEEIALRLWRRPGFFWLDGECPGHAEAHWSFLGCDPIAERPAVLGDARPVCVLPEGEPARDAPSALAADPSPAEVPRWVGYLAYDAHLCGLPRRLARLPEQPVACFARHAAVIALCHRSGRAFVVGDDADAAARLMERMRAPACTPRAHISALHATSRERHRAALAQAFEHIAAGDIYQVNLARRFTALFAGDPLALWLALRRASPVPLGAYLDEPHAAGGRVLMSRTMERFLHFEKATRRLVTRPIKGTLARRGHDAAEARHLRADPKERAEHAMIVDLMRNDLGRVAEVGSVRVSSVMQVERYAHLSHLVSSVECRVRAGLGLSDILSASFPPGSVTGAPKIRAMRIIEELEAAPRDAYTGAVGFIDRAGGLSLAVAIRSAVVEAGRVRFWAGGGIVEASDSEREIAETELKARVFTDAAALLGADFPLFPAAVLR